MTRVPGTRGQRDWVNRRGNPLRPYRLVRQPWWRPEDGKQAVTILSVDAAFDPAVLDRLNRIPGLIVLGTCAGHPNGPYEPYVTLFGVGVRRGLTVRTFAQVIRRHRLPLVDLRQIKPWDCNPRSWWAHSPRWEDVGRRMRWFADTVDALAAAVAAPPGPIQLALFPGRVGGRGLDGRTWDEGPAP
jgi:hypothetical protein